MGKKSKVTLTKPGWVITEGGEVGYLYSRKQVVGMDWGVLLPSGKSITVDREGYYYKNGDPSHNNIAEVIDEETAHRNGFYAIPADFEHWPLLAESGGVPWPVAGRFDPLQDSVTAIEPVVDTESLEYLQSQLGSAMAIANAAGEKITKKLIAIRNAVD